jgi:hypothetical protein
MLLLAVGQRIGQYGITEKRYFLLVLALWLGGIAVFYAVTGSRNIRIIPATLCALALLTFFGPWGAYAISRSSQAERFRDLLRRNELLAGDSIVPTARSVPFEDRREMSAALRYLIDTHGMRSLAAIDPALADTTVPPPPPPAGTIADHDRAQQVMARLGLGYVARGLAEDVGDHFFYAVDAQRGYVLRIAGYDVLLRTNLIGRVAVPMDGDSLVIAADSTGRLILLWRGQVLDTLSVDPIIERVRTDPNAALGRGVPPDLFSLQSESGGLRVRILFSQLGGTRRNGVRHINNAAADVLVGRQ